jgi:hypothetical protein
VLQACIACQVIKSSQVHSSSITHTAWSYVHSLYALVLLLLPLQAYLSQLSDMTRHIQSVQHASHQEKSMASTRMAACSNSMAKQRSAGVGFTSNAAPLSYAAAQAPLPACAFAAPGAAPPGAAGGAAAESFTMADFQQQQQQQMQQQVQEEAGVPWAQSNAMRKKMTSNAADYVSKRKQ